MIEKPLTDAIKQKASILYKYMLQKNDYVTKDEVCRVCGVKNERQARDIISVLASKKPIISTSDAKGYKLARYMEDLEQVIHTWNEIDSRINELDKRRQPLIKFYETAKSLQNKEN